jgi:hypothetical protein
VLVVTDLLDANQCSCLESSKRGPNVVERVQEEVMELETMSTVVSVVATSLNVYMFLSILHKSLKSIYKNTKKGAVKMRNYFIK